MALITLDIADDKLDFFKELVESLDFVQISKEYPIPKEHQDIVMERLDEIDNYPENKLDWDDVKDKI